MPAPPKTLEQALVQGGATPQHILQGTESSTPL